MFDLEQQIRQWHRSMSARLPLHRDAVNELESHLRDAVQKQIQNGLTPDAAWTVALLQFGSVDSIAAEYGKLPRFAVWQWWPARVVLGSYAAIAVALTWFVFCRFLAGRGNALLYTHVWTITLGYLAVLCVAAMAAWSILWRALTGWSLAETQVLQRTTRYTTAAALVLTILGVVLGGISMRLQSGSFWSWDLREIGGLAVVAWTVVVLSLLAQVDNERVGMLQGLMGGGLVIFCWMIPVFFPTGPLPRTVGNMMDVRVLILIGAAVASLFILALLPAGRLRFRHVD